MSGGERVRLIREETLYSGWSTLKRATFERRRFDGEAQELAREIYDHGDGAAILMIDPERRTVVLVRQFRWPAFAVGEDGPLIEVPAGVLDGAAPEARVVAEAEEETGYRPREVRRLFSAFMSPGVVTERLHFFVGLYGPQDRVGAGGGAEGEGEDIEVLEPTIEEALAMVASGEIRDAKTILLLQHVALTRLAR